MNSRPKIWRLQLLKITIFQILFSDKSFSERHQYFIFNSSRNLRFNSFSKRFKVLMMETFFFEKLTTSLKISQILYALFGSGPNIFGSSSRKNRPAPALHPSLRRILIDCCDIYSNHLILICLHSSALYFATFFNNNFGIAFFLC